MQTPRHPSIIPTGMQTPKSRQGTFQSCHMAAVEMQTGVFTKVEIQTVARRQGSYLFPAMPHMY